MKTILERKVAGEPMTRNVIQKICKQYFDPCENFCVFLEGGLGAGKTFCTREILKYFQIKDEVSSPTYTYMQEYSTNGKNYAHFDCYRLTGGTKFFEKGFQEIAEDPFINTLVEWPEKLSNEAVKTFSGTRFTLKINHGLGASMRTILLLEP